LEGSRRTDGIKERGVSVASRPSTRASRLPVTQLVCVARGVSPRSTPCVCALRNFLLLERVFRHRTTRRHGLAHPPPNWAGWSERVVTEETCRSVKSGHASDDVMSVRFFSFFDAGKDKDEALVGGETCIRCPFEWCNLPKLFGGLLAIFKQDIVRDRFAGNVRDLHVFVQLSKGTNGKATAASRPWRTKPWQHGRRSIALTSALTSIKEPSSMDPMIFGAVARKF